MVPSNSFSLRGVELQLLSVVIVKLHELWGFIEKWDIKLLKCK